MHNEEVEMINKKMGKNTPFTTPNGYFEHFTERMMAKLPEKKEKPIIIRFMRPLLYAAIFTGAIVLSATLFINDDNNQTKHQIATTTIESNESYFDDAADYAMVDNQDIYAYLLADL